MRKKPAAREAKAGACHHDLAPNERASPLTRLCLEPEGQFKPVRCGAHAPQARVLRLLPTESDRSGALVCAHTRKQAGRARGGQGRRVTPLSSTERESTLLLFGDLLESEDEPIRRGAARGRGKRACCASSPQSASAVAALLRTWTSRPRGGQGRGVVPRPCTEQESPVAIAAAFWKPRATFNARGAVRTCGKRACCASSPQRASAVPRSRRCARSRSARGSTDLHRTREASSLVRRTSRA